MTFPIPDPDNPNDCTWVRLGLVTIVIFIIKQCFRSGRQDGMIIELNKVRSRTGCNAGRVEPFRINVLREICLDGLIYWHHAGFLILCWGNQFISTVRQNSHIRCSNIRRFTWIAHKDRGAGDRPGVPLLCPIDGHALFIKLFNNALHLNLISCSLVYDKAIRSFKGVGQRSIFVGNIIKPHGSGHQHGSFIDADLQWHGFSCQHPPSGFFCFGDEGLRSFIQGKILLLKHSYCFSWIHWEEYVRFVNRTYCSNTI